jgi:two-component system, LuxR family, sensor histidine kinase DctS
MKMHPASAIDLDLLDLNARETAASHRRALWWLLGLLVLVTAAVLALAWFLRSVEWQEEDRQRTADAEWLDQTLRFHLRRLERDAQSLLPSGTGAPANPAEPQRPGQLWRSPGGVAWQGWLPAARQAAPSDWPMELQAQQTDAAALATLFDTARGLQRPTYAGPLPLEGTAGEHSLWLAVPRWEADRYLGSAVVALRLESALEHMVPAWFRQAHRVTVVDDTLPATANLPPVANHWQVPINLPGASLKLGVTLLADRPALAPRAFFGVALVLLLGLALALYALWRDVARRRRLELRLQTQMALRSAMEHSAPLGLRAWNLDGKLLYVNQAFTRMVGWSRAELQTRIGTPPPYWRAGDMDELAIVRQQATLPQAQQLGVELPMRTRDGRPLDVLLHGAPLRSAEGDIMGWMSSVLDVTERRRVERIAASQQKKLDTSAQLVAVGEVASTLAHELNQPLGAMSSFAHGLLNRLRDGSLRQADILPVVERLARMADKAGRVIQRVNAFARRQEMSRQPLELTAFVRRVAARCSVPADLQVELDLPGPTITVPADALLLEHALHNLVLNATEWAGRTSAQPARVRVSVWEDGERVAIRVEDSGPGVPDEQRGAIFEAFTSHKAGGMGMGLSICRSIVEAHHGHIDVARSLALHGAQFTLWLPLNP